MQLLRVARPRHPHQQPHGLGRADEVAALAEPGQEERTSSGRSSRCSRSGGSSTVLGNSCSSWSRSLLWVAASSVTAAHRGRSRGECCASWRAVERPRIPARSSASTWRITTLSASRHRVADRRQPVRVAWPASRRLEEHEPPDGLAAELDRAQQGQLADSGLALHGEPLARSEDPLHLLAGVKPGRAGADESGQRHPGSASRVAGVVAGDRIELHVRHDARRPCPRCRRAGSTCARSDPTDSSTRTVPRCPGASASVAWASRARLVGRARAPHGHGRST